MLLRRTLLQAMLCTPLCAAGMQGEDSLLGEFEHLLSTSEDRSARELGTAIARLGSDVVPFVSTALEGEPESRALRIAVSLLGREAFLPLEELSVDAALIVVEEVGDVRDLPIILQLPRTQTATLESALEALLAREERAWSRLLHLTLESSPEIAAAAVRAVGNSEDERSVAWLTEALEYELPLELLILSELQLVASLHSTDERCREEVRNLLWTVHDEQLLRKAVEVTGCLQDDGALDRLIELLSHDTQQVREDAYRALVRQTGLSLPPDPATWSSWLRRERIWIERQLPEALFELGTNNQRRIITALRDLSRRRFGRRGIVRELGPMLQHRNIAVRRVTCEALRQLGLKEAVPFLVEALDDADQAVAEAARGALTALGQRTEAVDPPALTAAAR